MDDDLVERLRANALDECDEAIDRIEKLEAKLAKAAYLLVDAMVQLREGKVNTRRNRADLIDLFLTDLKAAGDD